MDFYYGGTNLISTVTTPPYTVNWTSVPQGSYSLTAVATDNLNATTTSVPVTITVNRALALNFIEVDHLNTPRLIEDSNQQVVWRWDQQEPFGDNVPNENPSGFGAFEFPLRFAGQYADKETNLAYNYFRDYDSSLGTYKQSDLIGLQGGINTYAYVASKARELSIDYPSSPPKRERCIYDDSGLVRGDPNVCFDLESLRRRQGLGSVRETGISKVPPEVDIRGK